jgi:hypothetical protein
VAPTPNPWPGAPPFIPKPDPALFPDIPEYTVTQYRIQAVSPMVELDANENALRPDGSRMPASEFPLAGDGPNYWQYSIYYLAAVDVTVPTMNGNVVAKVRRVFEKKYDNPWTYAMFYHDDLEFQPSSALTITGPVHTNSSLYIGNSNFTAQSTVSYAGEYVNGFSPQDVRSTNGTSITTPNFPSDLPPSQESPYLPFGWNLKLTNADGSVNNDSYHELIERPVVEPEADPLGEVRLYNQAGVKVLIDQNNNVTVRNLANQVVTASSGGNDKKIYDAVMNAIATNRAMQDNREGKYVRITDFDIGKFSDDINTGRLPTVSSGSGWNGVLYIADTTPHGTTVNTTVTGSSTPAATTARAIRLVNGAILPSVTRVNPLNNRTETLGMTVVSENAVYIQGNYNTGGSSPLSNSGTPTSPTVSGYTRKPSVVVADAINVLSSNWSDQKSDDGDVTLRPATSTTINTALVSGNVPTQNDGNNAYSGGGENFLRLQEDWRSRNLTYYGSMVQLYKSAQFNTQLHAAGQLFKNPASNKWYYDTNFRNSSPPGSLQISAYLQQQRWYQVF